MKDKGNIIIGIFIGSLLILAGCVFDISKEKTSQKEIKEAEPIVIEDIEPSYEGMVSIYDGSRKQVFQYEGYIDIQNDGKDGNPIRIYINIGDNGYTSQ